MSEINARTAPPSLEANNNDVFMWAVFALGGAEKPIDVEDIYFKAFEIAPMRLGWRTRPELPNFKKTAKALQEIEANSHVGLLQKLGANYRRLTPAGVTWIEKYQDTLQALYGGSASVAGTKTSEDARSERELKTSEVWVLWKSGKALNISYLAHVLNCTRASSPGVWEDRLADLERLATHSGDVDVKKFAHEARSTYKREI